MEFTIRSYPNKTPQMPSFYIQIKGNYSGRPLRKPIPNCAAVYTDNPILFEIVYALFKGKRFEPDLKGTAVPYVRIDDLKNVISIGVLKYNDKKAHLLQNVNKIDTLLLNLTQQLKTVKQLQYAYCMEYLK